METDLSPLADLGPEDWTSILSDPSRLKASVRARLLHENAQVEQALAPVERLRATLHHEMTGRIDFEQADPPVFRGPWLYQRSRDRRSGHPVFTRRLFGPDHTEVRLWSAPTSAGLYLEVRSAQSSQDHQRFAVSVDDTGSEVFRIEVIDTNTSPPSRIETIEGTTGSFAWSLDGKFIVYVRAEAGCASNEVWKHRVGTARSDDILLYREHDPQFFVDVSTTETHGHILLCSESYDATEIRVLDAARPESSPRVLFERQPGVRYSVSERSGRFIVLTTEGGAFDGKVLSCALHTTQWDQCAEEIHHHPGRWIRDVLAFEDHLALSIIEDARPRIAIHALGGDVRTVEFDEPSYSLGVVREVDPARQVLRIEYASPRLPRKVLDVELSTGQRHCIHEDRVPSGHDPDAYTVERLDVAAPDGIMVPVTVLRHRNFVSNGNAPLYVTSYGAYGLVPDCSFQPHRLGLVDRGFVLATVHARGGRDKGHAWYCAGARANKCNTFIDTMSAIKHLVKCRYAQRGNITYHSASAGGLVAGVLVNEYADWFRAVVAEVPFVDILRTMSDPNLPLTAPEWSQWGNPLASKAERDTIASYDPCLNVRAQQHPHVFATAGIADPRVGYWEPARWIAALRAHEQGDAMMLLHTDLGGGHAGSGGTRQRIATLCRLHAFVLLAHNKAMRPQQV